MRDARKEFEIYLKEVNELKGKRKKEELLKKLEVEDRTGIIRKSK